MNNMKYRILKDVESQGWKEGEIVSVIGTISAVEGTLEEVPEETPHQHFLAVVDPVKMRSFTK